MLTHLLLAGRDGTRLFSRCWEPRPTPTGSGRWWPPRGPLWPEAFQKDDFQVAYIGDRVAVYTLVDQVMFFALGAGVSELYLQEYLRVAIAVVRAVERKAALTPKGVQDHYGAVVAALEETAAHGRLAWTVLDA
eukprot:TRINITY_DN14998_c0_g1_i1.p3 TRINITY_DN14998_c0_g1~~TRINITY_DN14998_c0_g1_i1.p3  ORF type:complete len:134 (+),score=49.71 TRINITY_DN14998_c0_g1_i1:3-404(+)